MERCPNEVLFQIYSYIHDEKRKDLFALRLTSRRLSSFFTSLLLDSEAIHRCQYSLYIQRSQRDTTRLEMEGFTRSVPELFIPFISFCQMKITFTVGYSFYETFGATGDDCVQSLGGALTGFWQDIQSLRALDEVQVRWYGVDKDAVLYKILSKMLLECVCQATDGKLSKLLWSTPLAFQVQTSISSLFPHFHNLQHLEICSDAEQHPLLTDDPPKSFLGDIVSRNTGLRSIVLRSHSPFPLCQWEDLFPSGVDELALERIDIRGILPNTPHHHPESESTSTSQSISLHLPRMPNFEEIYFRYHPSQPRRIHVDVDGLWNSFKDSGIQFSVLCHDYHHSSALMEYLTSYQGLKDVTFDVDHERHRDILDLSHSTLSVKAVLFRHARSLTALHITRYRWYHNWPNSEVDTVSPWPQAPSFIQLESLHIVIEFTTPNFQGLLDYVSDMPKLHLLEIGMSSYSAVEVIQVTHRTTVKRCALREVWIWELKDVKIRRNQGIPSQRSCQWAIEFPAVVRSVEGAVGGAGERFELNSFEISWSGSRREWNRL